VGRETFGVSHLTILRMMERPIGGNCRGIELYGGLRKIRKRLGKGYKFCALPASCGKCGKELENCGIMEVHLHPKILPGPGGEGPALVHGRIGAGRPRAQKEVADRTD